MADVHFDFKFLPINTTEHVARMAVLYRLLVPRKGTGLVWPHNTEEWEKAFLQVLLHWRRRALELCNAGAYRFVGGRVQRARNCHPWGIAVKPYPEKTVYCRYDDICPWCAAREASHIFARLERAFEPGYAVVTCTCADFYPGNITWQELHNVLQTSRLVMRALVLANSLVSRAAAWNVIAEPPAGYQGHEQDYCVRSRLLLLLPAESPHLLFPRGPGWSHSRDNRSTLETRQKAVAKVCAYPRGLLYGGVPETEIALSARYSLRLAERSGAFRGGPEELVDEVGENSNSQPVEVS